NPLVGPDAHFNGAVGLPLPSTDVSIRDEAGAETALGTVGEICVRGPQVMQGYWQRADETAQVMLPDGWLRTGDVVRMDPALTAQAVMDYCHRSLTAYKRPQAVYFRDELPKSNVGKILRRVLRDELAALPESRAA